jgi:hypothetical protein
MSSQLTHPKTRRECRLELRSVRKMKRCNLASKGQEATVATVSEKGLKPFIGFIAPPKDVVIRRAV